MSKGTQKKLALVYGTLPTAEEIDQFLLVAEDYEVTVITSESIVGYLTQGRGVTVHREQCRALAALSASHPERVLPVEWGRKGEQSYSVDVLVRAFDRKWLLKDLTNIIGAGNAHILALNSRVDGARGLAELRFTLKVADYGQLGELLSRLAAVPGVSEARRTP